MYLYRVNTTDLAVVETQQLTREDQFGYTVAMTATLLVVSANTPNNGAAYVYIRASSTSDYVLKDSLVPTTHSRGGGAAYGINIAICSPTTVVVGASKRDYSQGGSTILSTGAVHVFDLVDGNFTEHTQSPLYNPVPAQADFFGRFLACTSTMLAVSAPNDDDDNDSLVRDIGSVSIFQRDGNYSLVSKIMGSEELKHGKNLAINSANVIVNAALDDSNKGVLRVMERISKTAFNITQTLRTDGSPTSAGLAISEANVMMFGVADGVLNTGATVVFAG